MARQIIKSGQIGENRKARFEYSIDDTIEAGVSLLGAEVKSLRYGMVNLSDGFVSVKNRNLYLKNVAIMPLPTANKVINFDERRARILLLHQNQINRLVGKLEEKGATVFPLKLYFNRRGLVKVLLGIGFGKTRTDKRKTIRAREWDREKSRVLRRG
ncbi:MAG: SsrA-binding protein SmpB [Rickettsiales bacterium]|jgi:SsrA-binding protein|nr:SsrA-binding protein SmpB [Rickettsiales bacterium]